MSWRWLAMNQPGVSAAENELWVPAKTTSLSRRSQSSGEPLQPPTGLATAWSRGPGPGGDHEHRDRHDRGRSPPRRRGPCAASVRLRPLSASLSPAVAGGWSSSEQLADAEVDEPGAGQQPDDRQRETPARARRRSPSAIASTAARAPARGASAGRRGDPVRRAGGPDRSVRSGSSAAAAPRDDEPDQRRAASPRRTGRRGTRRGSRRRRRGRSSSVTSSLADHPREDPRADDQVERSRPAAPAAATASAARSTPTRRSRARTTEAISTSSRERSARRCRATAPWSATSSVWRGEVALLQLQPASGRRSFGRSRRRAAG